MDSLDRQILSILKQNARKKASDISKEIHLSVSTVIERIRKLEAAGIIESYTVIINEQKTGNDLTALMEVSLDHPRSRAQTPTVSDFTATKQNSPEYT